ncbi:MAG TPA: hypothetical protein VNG51_16845 [Ktedonobacteraceae bacterium]|nr:hypothetical protein [Ktedonobacteraceae bacterium]
MNKLQKIRAGHVSRFPSYPQHDKKRVNAFLYKNTDGAWIIETEKHETFSVRSHAEFARISAQGKMHVYINDINDYPWLSDAVADKQATPQVSRTRGLSGINFKVTGILCHGRLCSAQSWGADADDPVTQDFLTALREVSSRYADTDETTPAALGTAKLVKTLHGRRASRDSVMLRTRLLDHRAGGRSDTPAIKQHFAEAWEEDRNNAYASESKSVPGAFGESPIVFGSEHSYFKVENEFLEEFPTYFALATIFIPENVPTPAFGPIWERDDFSHLLAWPTEAGRIISGWWWKEELDCARECNWSVIVHGGYGWRTMGTWMTEWADETTAMRRTFENEGKKVQAGMMKLVTTATIGMFSRSPETLSLISSHESTNDDLPLCVQNARTGKGPLSPYCIHVEECMDKPLLTHVGAYIVMKMRVALWKRAMANVAAGIRVLATNYDSILTETPSPLPHSQETGDWKEKRLTKVYLPYPRAIECAEKQKLPGKPKKLRKTG